MTETLSPPMPRRPRGFTVLELLVTFGIIGLLLAIFLPVIGVARQAARRTQCQNNLRQIGLALVNYHELFEVFPPGYVARDVAADDSCDAETGPGFAWGTLLLGFLEQTALASSIDCKLDATAPANASIPSTLIAPFLCPVSSDPVPFDVTDGLGIYMLGPSSYVGMYGVGDLTASPGRPDGPGVFYRNSSTRTWTIKDGLTNTILLSERSAWQDFDPDAPAASACSTWYAAIPGADRPAGLAAHPLMRVGPSSLVLGTVAIDEPDVGFLRPNHTNYIGAFSSGHPGGLHLLLGDGSARFISDQIDEQTLRRLAQINDGGVTGEF